MTRVIIYPNNSGGVALVIPTLECGIPIEEIARKDVPAGVPYCFMNKEDLPQDFTVFDTLQHDFSTPDGHGIGHDAWFAEQAAKRQAELEAQQQQV